MNKTNVTLGQGARIRRRILKNASILSLGASSMSVPVVWKKPIVEHVVLPAHAVTSISVPEPSPGFVVSIDPQFDCESIVPFGDDIFVLVSVAPVPESNRQIDINIDCDGNQTNLTLALDSAGTSNLTINANSFCGSVIPDPVNSVFTRLTLTVTYNGEIAICSWAFETEAMAIFV